MEYKNKENEAIEKRNEIAEIQRQIAEINDDPRKKFNFENLEKLRKLKKKLKKSTKGLEKLEEELEDLGKFDLFEFEGGFCDHSLLVSQIFDHEKCIKYEYLDFCLKQQNENYFHVATNKCFGGFSISNKAKKLYKKIANTDEKIYDHNLDRDDPILIFVIMELKEEANGQCSSIYLEEIEKKYKNAWHISEYDGLENIEINHKRVIKRELENVNLHEMSKEELINLVLKMQNLLD